MLVSNLEVSGSIRMHGGGITGSLLGTSSFTITSSYAQSASYIVGGTADSSSFSETASYALTASYAENVPETASYALTASIAVSSSYASSSLTASYAVNSDVARVSDTASYVELARTASQALTSYTASYFNATASHALSSSYARTASYAENVPLTASYASSSLTASYAFTASYASSSLTASYAFTASLALMSTTASHANTLQGLGTASFITTGSNSTTQNITGSLTITENLTVLGSSSFVYVTASQVLLNQNTLTVFGSGSSIPNGGYRVEDTSSTFDPGTLFFNLPNQEWTLNNPLIVSGNLRVSGAIIADELLLTASQAYTASHLAGTASWAVSSSHLNGTASWARSASYVAGTASYAFTASYLDETASYAYTASNLAGTASWAANALTASYISGAIFDTAATASWATYSISASYLSGSTAIVTNLIVTETASISYLSATIVSSSIITGSNIFGNSNNNFHQFTGSVSITGSLTMNNSPIFAPKITGSLDGTASYAITASYVIGGSETSSFAITASYVATASYVSSSQFAITASYVVTASYVETASWATSSLLLGTASQGPEGFITTGSTGRVQAITGSLIITEGLTVLGSASISFITASQTVLNQNKLFVFTSGSGVPFGGYVVADTASWDGTGSYTLTSSFLYNSVDDYWILDKNLTMPSGTLLEGTSSFALTASYVEGSGNSDTASFAIEAYPKQFISKSEIHTIHEGFIARMKNVYNDGTYSLDQGLYEFDLGPTALRSNAALEVQDFYNNGIVFNNGEFTTVTEPETLETSGSNKLGNILSNIQQLTGSVGITGSLTVDANSSFNKPVTIYDNTNIIGILQIDGNPVVIGDSTFAGDLGIAGNLNLTGSAVISGDTVIGGTVKNGLTVSGTFVHTGSFEVTRNISASGTVTALSFTGSLLGSITSALTSSYLSSSADALADRLILTSQATRSLQLPNAFLSSDRTLFTQGLNIIQTVPASHSVFRVVGDVHHNSASIVLGSDSISLGTPRINQAPSIYRTAAGNTGDALMLSSAGGILIKGNTNYPAIAVNYSSSNAVVFGGFGRPIASVPTTSNTIHSWGANNNFLVANYDAPANDFYRMYAYFLTGTSRYYITDNNNTGVYLSKGGTSWTSTSDERKKDIIEPITNAIEKVEGLRTVIGKFKTDEEGTRRAFFIAQDMLEVFPEAVENSDPEDLGIQYTETAPLLAAAIKELAQENKDLRQEIAEIKLLLSQLS
jgi:hypothetical protein